MPCRTLWAPTFLPKISDRFSCEFVRPSPPCTPDRLEARTLGHRLTDVVRSGDCMGQGAADQLKAQIEGHHPVL